MSRKSLELRLGAFVPDIDTQLKEQGLEGDPALIENCQRNAYCITRLRIHRILTDAEADKAGNRLVKQIAKHVWKKGVS